MARRRSTLRTLAETRIYQKGLRLYYFAPEPIENPTTKKVAKWHPLCKASEGEKKAREIAELIIAHNKGALGAGDMPGHLETYRLAYLKKREKKRPREPARVKMFEDGSKEFSRVCKVIQNAFADFDVDQVEPFDIANFVDQWEGQRMGQVYRARLSDFFAWASRRGLRKDNPVASVKMEKPEDRDRYISHKEFHAIRQALMVGEDGRPTPSGPTVRAFVDLCYLTMQRPTEIRLLKWNDIDEADGVILFEPTKTEGSSGAKVRVPITPGIKDALARAKAAAKIRSFYVCPQRNGQPYTSRGIGDAWERACKRAGVTDATLKDLRAKAATDTKRRGHDIKQISVGLAHTDSATTETYIKLRDPETMQIPMTLPPES